jgi:NTE family protein
VFLASQGITEALSSYDTSPLKQTLEELVDFDLINGKSRVRLSVGAANVHTGNSIYFDNQAQKLRAEHIMASGSLPPGFPPVVIDGEHYWDGGIVSNSPLWYVLDDSPRISALIVQVDLFSARGGCRSTSIRCSGARRTSVLEQTRSTPRESRSSRDSVTPWVG